jgi:hypothetical protein
LVLFPGEISNKFSEKVKTVIKKKSLLIMIRFSYQYSDIVEAQNFIDESSTVLNLSMILIVIIVLHSLHDLKKILPSFGVLFDTINQAKYDLFIFFQVSKLIFL